MRTKRLLCSIALLTLMLSACKKPQVEPTNQPQDTNEAPYHKYLYLGNYMALNKVKPQKFQVQAEKGGVITGQSGSIITIPPLAFRKPNGAFVLGTVDVELTEILNNKQMLFSRVFPVYAYSQATPYFNSGGAFLFTVTQGGQEVKVKRGKTFTAQIPTQNVQSGMSLYTADAGVFPVDWAVATTSLLPSSDTSNFVVPQLNSNSNNWYNVIFNDFKWINIDKFIRTNLLDCSFKLLGADGLDDFNTQAYMVLKDENTVCPLTGEMTDSTIEGTKIANRPMNILVISVIEGELYSGVLDVTPESGQTYEIAMAKITDVEIEKLVESLP